MRSLKLLLGVLAAGVVAVAAAPQDICSSDAVALELRPLGTMSQAPMADYQLAFVAVDPRAQHSRADFVDIHYRVNNEDSVNLRVLTEQGLTRDNEMAKEAKIDNIQMEGGDVLRAYATYSIGGVACDTAIHTFNAPDAAEVIDHQALRRHQERVFAAQAEDEFWAAAAEDAEVNALQGACPAIALDQEILKQAGLRDTFVLSFENKTPARQLHYVDLHITNNDKNSDVNEWDGLRLASDMQLELAHKVMQPGVVIKPHEQISWFWSYAVTAADGKIVECTTPIETITAEEVTHEVNI